MPTIYQIIFIALLTCFVVLASEISGVRSKLRDWQDSIANRRLTKMLECDFCFSFWVGLALSLGLSILTLDATWIIVPVLSTPLTRRILV